MASRLVPSDQGLHTALLVLLSTSLVALTCLLAVDLPPLWLVTMILLRSIG
jgi:hypothetical protein